MEKFEAAKCIVCGQIHNLNENTYIKFEGNVIIGNTNIGLIGDNSLEDAIVCNTKPKSCLSTIFDIKTSTVRYR